FELAPVGARAGIQWLDPRPVGGRLHGMFRALLGAVGGARVGHRAPPVLDAVHAARHDLDEVEVPPALPCQHGLGEAARRVVHLGHVPPEGDRRAVHRLSGQRRHHALALGHHAPSLPHGPRPAWRPRRFSFPGTFLSRYGLTVHEAGEDAPRFLLRLRAGEAQAFEELVRTYQHRVFGVALRMLGNAAEAEEIAQEVFLRAHRALAGFRGDAKLSTWLYRITSRLCLNRLASGERRMTRRGEETLMRLANGHADAATRLEPGELEAALPRAIAELPDERR